MYRRIRFLGLAALALFAAACTPAAPTPPLEGARIGGPFALINQNGQAVTDRDFAGKYRIIYFGYTFCPDVCPVDVQHLAAGLKLVEARNPALGARIVPIFITVDPDRDTPKVLRVFVAAFHPRMVGLTGSAAQIAAVARTFVVTYHQRPPSDTGGYLVEHSRAAFLFGPDGRPLALLPQDQAPEAIADEIMRWAR